MSADVQGNDCDGLRAEVTPERADPSVVGDGRRASPASYRAAQVQFVHA